MSPSGLVLINDDILRVPSLPKEFDNTLQNDFLTGTFNVIF